MQLRNYRLKHNLTQKQLSLLLGVSPGAIEKREQAGTVPEQMLLSLWTISLLIRPEQEFESLLRKVGKMKSLMIKSLLDNV